MSSLPQASVHRFAPVHEDARRTIAEVNRDFGPIRRINYFAVQRGAVLGNHSHHRVTETFLLVSGRARLTTQAVGEGDEPLGAPEALDIAAPAVVVMPPRVAHAFRFDQPGTLICLADRAYAKEDDHPFYLDSGE